MGDQDAVQAQQTGPEPKEPNKETRKEEDPTSKIPPKVRKMIGLQRKAFWLVEKRPLTLNSQSEPFHFYDLT